MSDRRASPRRRVWLPVQVDAVTGGMAVTHDVSARGMLLLAAGPAEVGSAVTLRVQVPAEGGEERVLHGRVLRVQTNDDDREGLWRWRLAVEFDEPVVGLEEALDTLPPPPSGRGGEH